jgi:hypothetical protein
LGYGSIFAASSPEVPLTEVLEVDEGLKRRSRNCGEAGLGMMEVMVGVLVTLILGSVLLHLVRLGYALYELNSTTNGIAMELESARDLATSRNQQVRVIFKATESRFGVDRNGNGRLDSSEVEELPEGVTLDEDAVVTFASDGTLKDGSKDPRVVISNSRDSRSVSVSSIGVIEID